MAFDFVHSERPMSVQIRNTWHPVVYCHCRSHYVLKRWPFEPPSQCLFGSALAQIYLERTAKCRDKCASEKHWVFYATAGLFLEPDNTIGPGLVQSTILCLNNYQDCQCG